jgi:hypothetical protein
MTDERDQQLYVEYIGGPLDGLAEPRVPGMEWEEEMFARPESRHGDPGAEVKYRLVVNPLAFKAAGRIYFIYQFAGYT